MNLCIKKMETSDDIISMVAIQIIERMREGNGITGRAWLREDEIMEVLHRVEREWNETKNEGESA